MTRISLIALLLVAALAGAAAAEPVVLAVDGKDIYIDLGAKDGVGAGSELALLHAIVARDPRSGNTLRDWFALGTLTVVKSGNSISVAVAEPDLAKRVLAGDRVRLVSAKRAFIDPWAEQVAASKGQPAPLPAQPAQPPVPGAPATDHVALAREAWQETLGQPPEKRIARWQALLAKDPQNPYRRAIEIEIQSLYAQQKQRDDMLARQRSMASSDRAPRIAQLAAELDRSVGEVIDRRDRGAELMVASIERAVPGRPIQLAFLSRHPASIRGAYLFARPDGAAGYTRSELVRDGDAYLRGTIDGSLVRGNRVDWYVEVASAVANDDESAPAIGSSDMPRSITIDRTVVEEPIAPNRTHIDGHVDYVDFDGKFGKGYDQYYQAELDFTYRFLEPVYAVRLGFGTLSGTGGPKDVIDAAPNTCIENINGMDVYQCRRMTFSYVYTEVELRIRPNVALMLRPQAGILTTDTMDTTEGDRCQGGDITDCSFNKGYGARGRLRLGAEEGTNLVIGAAFTSRVGTVLEAAYHWLPNKIVPVQITVQVTDQPVVEDFGVRLIADVGLRRVPYFYPSARFSYQARDIDHSGFGGGIALNFDW
jgi:hypothetical protein